MQEPEKDVVSVVDSVSQQKGKQNDTISNFKPRLATKHYGQNPSRPSHVC